MIDIIGWAEFVIFFILRPAEEIYRFFQGTACRTLTPNIYKLCGNKRSQPKRLKTSMNFFGFCMLLLLVDIRTWSKKAFMKTFQNIYGLSSAF